MTILITGATGIIGTEVVTQLVARGAPVRALVRDPYRTRLPGGVVPVRGNLLDVPSLRAAMSGVRTLFLADDGVPDEMTRVMIALNLAREAGIERIVYLSVIHSDVYVNVPHFAGKYAIERMIERMMLPATILQPAYFINNDRNLRDALLGFGVYPMPIGAKGLAMVDARDVAEVAALELMRRERAPRPLPLERIELVGPENLTGPIVADIWSTALNRPVIYAGDDTAVFEQRLKALAPSWTAYDMRMMADLFQTWGMVPRAGAVQRLTTMLARPLHRYRDFARMMAATWRSA